jgi:hypothetical protein
MLDRSVIAKFMTGHASAMESIRPLWTAIIHLAPPVSVRAR